MRTITQMREDVANLVKELKEMRQKVIAENRDPNDEERKLGLKFVAEIEELEERIAEESKAQKTLDRMEKPEEDPDKTPIDTRKDVKEQESRDKFGNLGSMLRAVFKAAEPGGYVDPRLQTRATGLGESVPSDGGFLVDAES